MDSETYSSLGLASASEGGPLIDRDSEAHDARDEQDEHDEAHPVDHVVHSPNLEEVYLQLIEASRSGPHRECDRPAAALHLGRPHPDVRVAAGDARRCIGVSGQALVRLAVEGVRSRGIRLSARWARCRGHRRVGHRRDRPRVAALWVEPRRRGPP